jgi:sirohydrochlorin cobaltochelatase
MFMKNRQRIGAAIIVIGVPAISMVTCTSTQEASTTKAVSGGKPVVLVVSVGTSVNDSREKTIGGIEKAIAAAYPDYEVRRAFTSQTIIDRVFKRDGITIDNVEEAMNRLEKDGVRDIIVQPTHIMEGFAYDDVMAEVQPFERNFASVTYGKPLLYHDDDYNQLIDLITAGTQHYTDAAIVFMGHGTEHPANATYAKLDAALHARGFANYHIGTVESTPSLDDVIAAFEQIGAENVVLQPLMIVAGDHANNDMAGDDDDSWKTILTSKGYKVTTVLKGLGEDAGIQQMFVRHVSEVVGRLAKHGG